MLISVTDDWCISHEIAIRLMLLDPVDDKSTLVEVMAWCRQATSHYLSQCWPRSVLPNGVTRPQWDNIRSKVITESEIITHSSHLHATISFPYQTQIDLAMWLLRKKILCLWWELIQWQSWVCTWGQCHWWFLLAIQIEWKIHITLIQSLDIRPLQIFLHVTTAHLAYFG